MKKKINKNFLLILIFVFLSILIASFVFYFSQKVEVVVEKVEKNHPELTKIESKEILRLTSPVFENNQSIPVKYTCDGESVNPPLQIDGVPEGTKSLALIVVDINTKYGVSTHWVMWNIDPKTSLIEENSVPEGSIQGTNSFGKQSYSPPCLSSGIHHYYFRLYALDKKLGLNYLSEKRDIEKAMCRHFIKWVELIGFYQQQ